MKSTRELYALRQEFGVYICKPSSVNETRWIPCVHRALKVLLWHGLEKDIVTDDRQYSVALQHIEHLAFGINNSRSSRAGKDGQFNSC